MLNLVAFAVPVIAFFSVVVCRLARRSPTTNRAPHSAPCGNECPCMMQSRGLDATCMYGTDCIPSTRNSRTRVYSGDDASSCGTPGVWIRGSAGPVNVVDPPAYKEHQSGRNLKTLSSSDLDVLRESLKSLKRPRAPSGRSRAENYVAEEHIYPESMASSPSPLPPATQLFFGPGSPSSYFRISRSTETAVTPGVNIGCKNKSPETSSRIRTALKRRSSEPSEARSAKIRRIQRPQDEQPTSLNISESLETRTPPKTSTSSVPCQDEEMEWTSTSARASSAPPALLNTLVFSPTSMLHPEVRHSASPTSSMTQPSTPIVHLGSSPLPMPFVLPPTPVPTIFQAVNGISPVASQHRTPSPVPSSPRRSPTVTPPTPPAVVVVVASSPATPPLDVLKREIAAHLERIDQDYQRILDNVRFCCYKVHLLERQLTRQRNALRKILHRVSAANMDTEREKVEQAAERIQEIRTELHRRLRC